MPTALFNDPKSGFWNKVRGKMDELKSSGVIGNHSTRFYAVTSKAVLAAFELVEAQKKAAAEAEERARVVAEARRKAEEADRAKVRLQLFHRRFFSQKCCAPRPSPIHLNLAPVAPSGQGSGPRQVRQGVPRVAGGSRNGALLHAQHAPYPVRGPRRLPAPTDGRPSRGEAACGGYDTFAPCDVAPTCAANRPTTHTHAQPAHASGP